MNATPESRIREHLERRGGSTRVELVRLLGTWGLGDDPSGTNRVLVARALEGVGVISEPPVETAPGGTRVELRIADAHELASNKRLRQEAVADPDVDDDGGGGDDEEIPSWLPRTLLTAGALGTVGSLFLPWFSGQRGGEDIPGLSTAWEWLSVIDVLLMVVGLAAAIVVVLKLVGDGPALLVAGLATLGAACVAYRIVSPPAGDLDPFVLDVGREPGPFLAVVFLIVVVAGAGLLAPSRASGFPLRRHAADPPAQV